MQRTSSPRKVVRSICRFAPAAGLATEQSDTGPLAERLVRRGFQVQTRRACFAGATIADLREYDDGETYLSVGTMGLREAIAQLDDFADSGNVAFNVDATEQVNEDSVSLLLRIVREAPAKTFSFAFTFDNRPSSPYFPSAAYGRPGFAVGLQPTDLAAGCASLDEWFDAMAGVWDEIVEIYADREDFLGIDSSVAPLFKEHGSLVYFIRRLYGSFSRAVCSDVFMRITDFIVERNPRPTGLCGLMLPCLEDFVLAEEYENGRFSLERNLFLALHCGLGVDTYPLGVDEDPESVLQVLRLLRHLSVRYGKPLSARFVSDGRARVGEMTRFGNRFLRDVVVRPLL